MSIWNIGSWSLIWSIISTILEQIPPKHSDELLITTFAYFSKFQA